MPSNPSLPSVEACRVELGHDSSQPIHRVAHLLEHASPTGTRPPRGEACCERIERLFALSTAGGHLLQTSVILPYRRVKYTRSGIIHIHHSCASPTAMNETGIEVRNTAGMLSDRS